MFLICFSRVMAWMTFEKFFEVDETINSVPSAIIFVIGILVLPRPPLDAVRYAGIERAF
jgi:hypothetical protein